MRVYRKRLLAAVLVFVLFFSVMPVTAGAEDDSNLMQREEVTHNGVYECADNQPLAACLLDNLHELNDQLGLENSNVDRAVSYTAVEQISYSTVTPSTGDVNVLVVMADFSDVKFDENFTNEYVQKILFGAADENADLFPLDSFSAWYKRSSFGKLNISGDIVNVHLNHTRDYYSENKNMEEEIPEEEIPEEEISEEEISEEEATGEEIPEEETTEEETSDEENSDEDVPDVEVPDVKTDIWKAIYEQNIDWKQYDSNNDHYVDALCMIVAGEAGDWASQWWSYCHDGNTEPIDQEEQYHVGKYAFCMESHMITPETIIHEFGHMMGLPDLYNTFLSSSTESGLHTSDIMCDNTGDMNGLCKMLLGWLDASQIHIVEYGQDVSEIRLRPYAQSGDIALCMVNEGQNSIFSEYYLAEYYVPYGNDSIMGMLDAPAKYMRLFHVNAELSDWGDMLAHDNYSTGEEDDCLLIQAVDHDAEYRHGFDYCGFPPPPRQAYRSLFHKDVCCGYQEGDELTPYTTPSTDKYAQDRRKDSPGVYSGLYITNFRLGEEAATFSVSYENKAADSTGIILETVAIDRCSNSKDFQIRSNRDIYRTNSSMVAYVREKASGEYVEDLIIDTRNVWPGNYDIYPYHAMIQVMLSDESLLSDGVAYEIVLPAGMFTTGYGMMSGETVLDIPHYHDVAEFEEKAATCKEAGNIMYWYCGDCGKYFSDVFLTKEITEADTVIERDSTNHTGETYLKNQSEATATSDGYTGDVYCSDCDALIEKGSVIPAKGTGDSGGSSTDPGGTGGSSTESGSTGGPSTGSGSTSGSSAGTGDASSGSAKDQVDTPKDEQKDKAVTTTLNPASDTLVTVTVKSDEKGEVTSATAAVSKNIAKDSNKVTISANVMEQIKEAAETDVAVTMTVKDADGKTKYKLKVDTADLKAGNDLYIYQLNTKTGAYTMVNAKTYVVSKKGDVSVSMDRNATYELLSAKEAKKVEKQILSTVKVKKSAATVKKGAKTSVVFSSGFNMKNVKSIRYSTSSKAVAAVSKSGSVTTKKEGTATIKAKIILKNGAAKTVKMKIVVR